MAVETWCNGARTTLRVTRHLLQEGTAADLDTLDLPLETEPCDPELHGTTVVLRGLSQRYDPPNEDRLLERLFHEYGLTDSNGSVDNPRPISLM